VVTVTSKDKHPGIAGSTGDITASPLMETPLKSKGQALRRQAEAVDRKELIQTPEDLRLLSPEETREVLHELRVHRIELEMQNLELRRAQEELVAERRRYFDLYELAPVGYCSISEQGLIRDANLSASILFGVARCALCKQPITRFILKEDQNLYYLLNKQLLATGEPQTGELGMVREDGTPFRAHLNFTVAKSENGSPVSLVVLSDITERKRAEERLRLSEERFRKLFEGHSAVKLVIEAKTGAIIDANDAAVQFYGWSIETLKQMHIQQINMLATDAVQAAMEQAALAENTRFEFRHRRMDGSIREVEVFSNKIEIAGRDLLHSIIHDITERKRAEKNNLELERRFQESKRLESLGVLTGGIAHDFNNILSVILGHCDILSDDVRSGMEQKKQVGEIERAAMRAAVLCQQMLAYAGKNPLIQTWINLRLMVEEATELLQPTLKNKIDIEFDFNGGICEIIGDRAQIEQVIMNLYCNAAEAIGEKKGTIAISLNNWVVRKDQEDRDFLGYAIPAGDYVCLTVSDNGSGMDVETQKRLFEPFYTTKCIGRGLGLSAVLGIVKSHDGALQFSTTPGVGTTVKVFLPQFAVSGIAAAGPTADISPAKGRCTFLLVNDEASDRILGSALLKAMGFVVMTATGGREAIEIHRENRRKIDLILLDLVMPGMGGIETYRLLRQISPVIPIVICSGYNGVDLAEDFTNDPYVEVTQKPYKLDQLRNIFKKFVETTE